MTGTLLGLTPLVEYLERKAASSLDSAAQTQDQDQDQRDTHSQSQNSIAVLSDQMATEYQAGCKNYTSVSTKDVLKAITSQEKSPLTVEGPIWEKGTLC